MVFFKVLSSKKKKQLKKLREKARVERFRRDHMILGARAAHEKSRKQAEKYLAKGGWGESPSMEQKDAAYAAGAAAGAITEKVITIGAKTISKLKRRQRKIAASKKTHLSKLKSARTKLKGRTRS